VLIAEDNEINQFAATQLPQKLGFTVEIADNGREAIEMTERAGCDAVFMDCQMPEVDGYEAAAAIRSRENGGAHLPIIAMTANTMDGDREKRLAAGMDDYIGKPLSLNRLSEVCAHIGTPSEPGDGEGGRHCLTPPTSRSTPMAPRWRG